MEISQVTTEYSSSAFKDRGWAGLRITQESGKDPDIIFRGAFDPAVKAVAVADFVETVANVHHEKHGVNVTEKCAAAVIEYFSPIIRKGASNRP